MEETTVTHFTHTEPGHVLSLVDGQSTEYTCQLCKISDKKLRFKCNKCPDFNVDPVCAICKPDVSSSFHPDNHILVFFLEPELTTTEFLCSVCNRDIKGAHYSCCDFSAHPLCTKFPETIRAGASRAHEDHELKGFVSKDPTTCHVCHNDCVGLTYQCEECDVAFHPACLVGFGERELTDGYDVDGNNRGFRKFLQGFMVGLDLWDILQGLLSLGAGI